MNYRQQISMTEEEAGAIWDAHNVNVRLAPAKVKGIADGDYLELEDFLEELDLPDYFWNKDYQEWNLSY